MELCDEVGSAALWSTLVTLTCPLIRLVEPPEHWQHLYFCARCWLRGLCSDWLLVVQMQPPLMLGNPKPVSIPGTSSLLQPLALQRFFQPLPSPPIPIPRVLSL